jgi:serine/threonine protein kinase
MSGKVLMSKNSLQPGHVLVGRYRIEESIGEGGMGSVYRATQLAVDRAVAIKVIAEFEDGVAPPVERFEREARALARLNHHNSVRLFDFGMTEEQRPFIVMELLRGQDLAHHLASVGRLAYPDALGVALQVLRALEEAHDQGIIHRDIKPANIFLCSSSGSALSVKVLDFGIAGVADGENVVAKLTATRAFVGSATYMAPEQARGEPGTPQADLYAVGVVLFEMLTGRTLFEAPTLTALLIAKQTALPPNLREVCNVEVPAAVQVLLDDLLASDVQRRPSSAREVAERIEAILGAAPSAPPPELLRAGNTVITPIAQPISEPQRPRAEASPLGATVIEGGVLANTSGAVTAPPARRSRSIVAIALAVPLILGGALLLRSVLGRADRSEPSNEPAPPIALTPAPAEATLSLQPQVAPVLAGSGGASDVPAAPPPEPAEPTGGEPRKGATTVRALSPKGPSPAADEWLEPPVGDQPVPEANYSTVAAVIAARNAGKLSQPHSNRLIRELRARRLEARSRAAEEHRAGDITLEELKARQKAIEDEFEGSHR